MSHKSLPRYEPPVSSFAAPPRYSAVNPDVSPTRTVERGHMPSGSHPASAVALTPPSPTAPTSPQADRSRGGTEHVYTLCDSSKLPWATLTVLSAATSPKQTPLFWEGDWITGTLDLKRGNGQYVQRIELTVKGTLTSATPSWECSTRNTNTMITAQTPTMSSQSPMMSLDFLDISTTIWTASSTTDPTTHALPGSASQRKNKLAGDVQFLVSLQIPSQVQARRRSVQTKRQSFRGGQVFEPNAMTQLPESYNARDLDTNIQYSLEVRFHRGRFRTDYKINTPFNYVPFIRPTLPSPARCMAYSRGASLPGPQEDPDGWYNVPSISITGKIFGSREVKVGCTFSLAKPLCYSRNSILPVYLTLSSDDAEALDLISIPTTRRVCLRLSVWHRLDRGSPPPPNFSHAVRKDEDGVESACVGREDIEFASVWSKGSTHDAAGNQTRQFEGEIKLKRSLASSCRLAYFSVEYSVLLLYFQATGFAPHPAEHAEAPLLEQPVEIATALPHGVRPRSYASSQTKIVASGGSGDVSTSLGNIG